MVSGPSVAVIVVNYRTPRLTVAAMERAVDNLEGTGLAIESLVVDNSGDFDVPDEAAVRVCRPGENVGYAQAVNLAVEATEAEWLIVQNPDVEVQEGCLPRLLDVLRTGAAAAGPRLYWDRECRLLMPPLETRRFMDEVRRALAHAWPAWTPSARRRWRRRARACWEATSLLDSSELSGAILAVRRDAWRAVGPMDPGYFLYFEEQDWLLRARELGHQTFYVPDAVAIHAGGRAVAGEPAAAEWFGRSHARFRRQHLGVAAQAVLRNMERSRSDALAPVSHRRVERLAVGTEAPSLMLPEGSAWVEVAIDQRGFPAAAERLSRASGRSWRLPADVWERTETELFATAIDDQGRETQVISWRPTVVLADQNRSVSARV